MQGKAFCFPLFAVWELLYLVITPTAMLVRNKNVETLLKTDDNGERRI